MADITSTETMENTTQVTFTNRAMIDVQHALQGNKNAYGLHIKRDTTTLNGSELILTLGNNSAQLNLNTCFSKMLCQIQASDFIRAFTLHVEKCDSD
jgi:hypothetical protein